MESLAALLKQTREDKGISLKEVETATRVPRAYLEALEGGGDRRLLADQLYLIPFLRTYATFLGLNPFAAVTRFLADIQKANEQPVRVSHTSTSSSTHLSSWAIPFLLLFVLFGVFSLIQQQGGLNAVMAWLRSLTSEEEEPSSVVSTAEESPAPEPEPVPKPTVPETSSSSLPTEPSSVGVPPLDVPSASPQAKVSASQPESPATTTPSPSEAPVVAAATPPPELPSADRSHRLNIQAKTATWIRIAIDNQRSKDLILQPGESREWSAQESFTLSLGNAGGVDLTLDGQAVPPVGKSGEVRRNIRLPAEQ